MIKYFLISLGLVCVVACSDDPYGGVRPDIGKQIHESGRPAMWRAKRMPLDNSEFTAVVGPGRYTDTADNDWDYYRITIERRQGNSSYVYFEREVPINDIPSNTLSKSVEDVVSFDKSSQVVIFRLGERVEKYKLPK